MPSPFKRRSGPIKPMSQAELDASLAELEAKAAEDEEEGVYIVRDPNDASGEGWFAFMTPKSRGNNPPRREDTPFLTPVSHDEAERHARRFSEKVGVPYLGER